MIHLDSRPTITSRTDGQDVDIMIETIYGDIECQLYVTFDYYYESASYDCDATTELEIDEIVLNTKEGTQIELPKFIEEALDYEEVKKHLSV